MIPETDSYATTWSDIDVGCEACHGAGSRSRGVGQMSDMARPLRPNFELAVQTSDISSGTGRAVRTLSLPSRRDGG